MEHEYTPHEIRLAHELAETLQDHDSLACYLQYTRRFSEEHLRKTLAKVMSIEETSIRKSRGALYTYLVNGYGRRRDSRPRS